jgi:DNA-binding response OmpR family regulator
MKKNLVVDDEPDIALSVKKGLECKGFAVDVYTNPQSVGRV